MSSDTVVVHGITIPEAAVSIRGRAVAVDENGRFQAEVTLVLGANLIEVTAEDAMGNRESKALTVTSIALIPLPFFLVVGEPQDQSIVSDSPVHLSGRTIPGAMVSVNGVSIPVDELGIFSTSVRLQLGPNTVDVLASSPEGELLGQVIAVIFRP